MTKKSNEHIKDGWLNFAAAMQATLAKNGCKGYAKLTVKIIAHDLDATLWLEPVVERVSPVSISKSGMSQTSAIMLVGAMEME